LDIREKYFEKVTGVFKFQIISTQSGMLAGMSHLMQSAKEIGIELGKHLNDGALLNPGSIICVGYGSALQIALAEDSLMSVIGKASGVASAAHHATVLADGKAEIVCGAWKKIPNLMKSLLRDAIMLSGAGIRISKKPFLYLDKNYLRLTGGIQDASRLGAEFNDRILVIQLKGEFGSIVEETKVALKCGAAILMVDTGSIQDLKEVRKTAENFDADIQIGFAGSVTPDRIIDAIDAGANIVCIGRSIIDAPLLDFRLDVLQN